MPAIIVPILAGALALGPPTASPTPATVDGFGEAVADQALEATRGGESPRLVVVDVDSTGTVEGNTAVGTVGGRNVVTGGAFGNAAGINTVIQNSGANVLIQNGTAVNVQFGGPVP